MADKQATDFLLHYYRPWILGQYAQFPMFPKHIFEDYGNSHTDRLPDAEHELSLPPKYSHSLLQRLHQSPLDCLHQTSRLAQPTFIIDLHQGLKFLGLL
jgi:hypothetical protein